MFEIFLSSFLNVVHDQFPRVGRGGSPRPAGMVPVYEVAVQRGLEGPQTLERALALWGREVLLKISHHVVPID